VRVGEVEVADRIGGGNRGGEEEERREAEGRERGTRRDGE